MASSRVSSVQLTLRVPAELASASDQLRATVERELLQRILDEVERLLHARFGATSVIRIRRLAVHWRLGQLELGAMDVVGRLALDLATSVIHEIEALPEDERLRPHGESFAWLASEAHAAAAYLADTVDRMPASWIHVQRDPRSTWRAVADAGEQAIRETVHYLTQMERLEPVLVLADDDVLVAVAAAAPDVAPVIAIIRARERARQVAPAPPAIPPGELPTGLPNAPLPTTTERTPIDRTIAPDERTPPTAVVKAQPSVDGEPIARGIEPPPLRAPSAEAAIADEVADQASGVETQHAGVFYLIARTLEIELAERLWAAGLPEGDVLAHIAATIIATFDDPAVAWFGGAFDRPVATPEIPAWAASEVCETVQHVLGRRLVRFGVTLSPALLDARLEQLASTLAPLVALSPTLHRVVTRGAAALCMLVCARLGVEPSLAVLRDVCTRRGQLVLTPDALHVVMSETAVDIDHRRAGLDLNPGNAPWIGRTVRIEFV